jgi:hypothetical protein
MVIERKREGPGKRRGRAPFSGPVVAGVLALLFTLQGFLAIGASAAHYARGGGEASIGFSIPGVTCFVNMHGGNLPPAHEGDHAQCCVLCGARDLTGHILANVAQTSNGTSLRRLSGTLSGWPCEPLISAPTGWTSSWSSRAPPFFS